MDNSDAAEHAITALTLAGWTLLGAAIGLAAALIVLVITIVIGRRVDMLARIHRRTRGPLVLVLSSLGAWSVFGLVMPSTDSVWYNAIHHALLLILVGALGWAGFSLANLVQDIAAVRIEKDSRDARRLQTQAQVLRRVLQSVIVIVTVIAALLTFPATRAPLGSLLASASVISIVVGLAAQSSLGNAFAGLQLAFTDAIRVGDTVTVWVNGKEEAGVVEELTLTYVVLRVWDERRVLLPSTEFTTKSFENWSRRDTEQLGTIFIPVDWSVPMAQIRQEVERLLMASDLWDKRTWNVQMVSFAPGATFPTVRIVVSAQNPGDLHDLKCEIREELVAWIATNIPSALPRSRSQTMDIHEADQNLDDAKVAKLAEELAGISGQDTGKRGVPDHDPIHAARLLASRKKTKRTRRRSVLTGENASENEILDAEDDPDATMILTGGSRLFSGTPDALQRRKIYDGPGEDVVRRREETATMQALDAQGKLEEKDD